ncbi:MAG: helix-turn-helix transcriptional regulator [Candidatus Yanofskybacteria bacterium]|nr:helix-turn-helix transcriptional regulator [Candidatus Yanofskybacteria bacterium]
MEEKKSKTIGDKIKLWRKKKDLTQDALAKKANIPYTTLAKIESDVIENPSLQTITKIAEGLSVSLDELVK